MRTRGIVSTAAIAALMVGGLFLSASATRAATTLINVPADYSAIQGAVNAAEAIPNKGPSNTVEIDVASGTYNEHVLVSGADGSYITIKGVEPQFDSNGHLIDGSGTIIDGAGLAPTDDHVGVNPAGQTITNVTFEDLGARNARSNDAMFGVDAGSGTAERITFDHLAVEERDDNDLDFARDGSGNLITNASGSCPSGYRPNGENDWPGPAYPCISNSDGYFFEADAFFFWGDVRNSTIDHCSVIGDDPRGNNAVDGTDPTKIGFGAGFFDIGHSYYTSVPGNNALTHDTAKDVARGFETDSNATIDHSQATATRVGIKLYAADEASVIWNTVSGSGNDSASTSGLPSYVNKGGGISTWSTTQNGTLGHNTLVDNEGSALRWNSSGTGNVINHNDFGATCDVNISGTCVTSDSDANTQSPNNTWVHNQYQ